MAALLTPFAAFLYFFLRYHSHAYLFGGLLLLAAFLAAYGKWDKISAGPLGPWLLGFAAVALPGLGLWQFLQLQDLGDMDQASYTCAFWNIRHGWWHYAIRDFNMFGIHSQYTALLWIPWHFLTGEAGLKIGKALCLLAAVFLILSRDRGNRKVTSWLMVALLLSPPVASQFFFGFHPEFIAAPALILLLEAYRDHRLGRFLACTAFLAYSKEVFTLVVGGVLLVAVLEKRPWKWILWPGLLCCVQMAVYWFLILPRFAPKGNHLSFFMPASPQQALAMWGRPQVLLYFWHVALPFLPLLLAFPKRYLLIPLPLMLFYAAFPDPLFMVMWPNYAFPLAFLCTAGFLLRMQAKENAAGAVESLDTRIFMACAVTSLLCYPLWREAFSLPVGNLARARALDRIHGGIPDSAAVIVNGPFLARFAGRREIGIWNYRVRPLEIYDYAILDSTLPYWLNKNNEKTLAAGIDTLSNSPDWTREYAADGLFVFHHHPHP